MRERRVQRLGRRTSIMWTVYLTAGALEVTTGDLPCDLKVTDDQHRLAIAALRAELMDALGISDDDAADS